jgi:hypothetical protein
MADSRAGETGLGFRTHSGWAATVAVTGSLEKPVVLERRRIVIARGPRQPYHAAEPLPFTEAEALIRKCHEEALEQAVAAIRELQREFEATCAGVLVGRPRPIPPLAAILKSHAAIHTAEGLFYREVCIVACHQCGLRVTAVAEKEMTAHIAALPKLGPPWTADEKLASLAAWDALKGETWVIPHPRGEASSGS